MSFRNWYIDNKLRMNALECNEHEWRWMVLNCHVMTYKLIKHDILTGVDFMVHVIPWLEQIMVISQLTSGELLTCLKILPQKKDFISKKDSKKGVGKWVFLLGRPPGRCYVSFWECTKKYALVHLKKDIEEQFHLKYFLGNKISSKLPETGFPRFRFFFPVLAEPFFEDYVSTDLKRLDAEPAELLSNRPMDDPLEQRGRCFEGVGLIWVG